MKIEKGDFYGIGQALMGAMNIYFQGARRSGRTLSLVNSLKDGDRVVFDNEREARRVERLCKERGVMKVSFIVIDPKQPERLFERVTSQGRTIFDHSWVERFFLDSHERAMRDLASLEIQASGYGEAHLETGRKAEEISRWRQFFLE
jgi:hypothetical protein